jgi:hypothetical protein
MLATPVNWPAPGAYADADTVPRLQGASVMVSARRKRCLLFTVYTWALSVQVAGNDAAMMGRPGGQTRRVMRYVELSQTHPMLQMHASHDDVNFLHTVSETDSECIKR